MKAAQIDEERVDVRNPNGGSEQLRIRRGRYEPVRRAILEAIDAADELANAQLRAAIEARTSDELWVEHSVGWYATVVKLDLEARELIATTGSPQQLRLTEAGRNALAAGR